MELRALGRSGVSVSRIIFGCGDFGLDEEAASRERAFALLDAAFELGITTFDVEEGGAAGIAETWLGGWLATKEGAARERVTIQARTFGPAGDGAPQRGLGRTQIPKRVDDILARLGTEQVAVCLAHGFDPAVPQEETLLAFDQLRRAGKIGTAGAVGFTGEQLAEALEISELEGLGRYEVVQNRFSLLDQDDRETVFPVCHEHGVGYQPSSGRDGGLPAGRAEPDPALDALRDRATLLGVSMAVLALAWVLHVPEVTGAVVRPTRREQLSEIEQALRLKLDAAERTALARLFS